MVQITEGYTIVIILIILEFQSSTRMTAADVAVETQPQKLEGEKKNVFERVKLRFSSRSKKQKIAKGSDTTESMKRSA